MVKKRIGILRGGAGREYTMSLNKGGGLISHIFEHLGEKYKPIDILVDKDHVWHMNGLPVNPSDLMHQVDVVWNTAHHSFSNILESLSIPHIGANSFLGSLMHNREALKEHMKSIGVSMPRNIVLPLYQRDFDGPIEKYAVKKAKEIFEKFASPWIVKSYTEDTTMGIHLAKTFPELVNAIDDGVAHEKSILIEEFIGGKVGSLHSVPGFRGQDVYVFPFGKYASSFAHEEKDKLISFAKELYSHINAKHYIKSDFVLTPRGKIYLLGVEVTPDLRENSHFCEVCESADIKVHQVLEHILEKSLNNSLLFI